MICLLISISALLGICLLSYDATKMCPNQYWSAKGFLLAKRAKYEGIRLLTIPAFAFLVFGIRILAGGEKIAEYEPELVTFGLLLFAVACIMTARMRRCRTMLTRNPSSEELRRA